MSRLDWEEIETVEVEHGKMRVVYDYALDPYNRPNDVFGIWEPVDKHEGGVTVRNPDAYDPHREHMWWRSINYTPAELAKEYAKQGRTDPSKEAYDSLQKELQHYIAGDMYIARARVLVGDEVLVEKTVSFDHSPYLFDNTPAEEAAKRRSEFFHLPSMLKEAKAEAKKRAAALREIADALDNLDMHE